MSPRDLFGVAVRVGALILWFYAVTDVIHLLMKVSGNDPGSRFTMNQDVYAAIFYSVFGAVVLLGANLIVRAAYGAVRK